MSDEYTCAICGGTFKKGWSEEEALAEKDVLFAGVPIDECAVVCDPCWKRMGLDLLPEPPK
jgi:hypothetical protein